MKPKTLPRWQINYIKGRPPTTLGHVEAPTAEAAIKKAIEQFKITEPHRQQRVAAVRTRRYADDHG